MKRVAVLISGGGTNLQALIDASAAGQMPGAQLALVVASSQQAYGLERARLAEIPAQTLRPKDFDSADAFDAALCQALREASIDLVVLAGYLTVLGPQMLAAYTDRIINVHPALLPAFGGKGYYGLRVHEAVLRRGCKVTGATVHLVNEEVDGGAILLQKAVDVLPEDTAEILQRRVMEQAEWILLPQAVELMCGKGKDDEK